MAEPGNAEGVVPPQPDMPKEQEPSLIDVSNTGLPLPGSPPQFIETKPLETHPDESTPAEPKKSGLLEKLKSLLKKPEAPAQTPVAEQPEPPAQTPAPETPPAQ